MKRPLSTAILTAFVAQSNLGVAQDFRALPPLESSPLQLVGSDTPKWPSVLFIEFEGQITIHARFRFVYDAENGPERNPYLLLLPDKDSQSQLPSLKRTNVPTEKAEEIHVENVEEAARALLGKILSAELMDGKHKEVTGEGIITIEGISAGYECDNPSFGTKFVRLEREIKPPAASEPGRPGSC